MNNCFVSIVTTIVIVFKGLLIGVDGENITLNLRMCIKTNNIDLNTFLRKGLLGTKFVVTKPENKIVKIVEDDETLWRFDPHLCKFPTSVFAYYPRDSDVIVLVRVYFNTGSYEAQLYYAKHQGKWVKTFYNCFSVIRIDLQNKQYNEESAIVIPSDITLDVNDIAENHYRSVELMTYRNITLCKFRANPDFGIAKVIDGDVVIWGSQTKTSNVVVVYRNNALDMAVEVDVSFKSRVLPTLFFRRTDNGWAQ